MKNLIKKFGGAIFLYLAIVCMIIAVNNRLASINETEKSETIAYVNE